MRQLRFRINRLSDLVATDTEAAKQLRSEGKGTDDPSAFC